MRPTVYVRFEGVLMRDDGVLEFFAASPGVPTAGAKSFVEKLDVTCDVSVYSACWTKAVISNWLAEQGFMRLSVCDRPEEVGAVVVDFKAVGVPHNPGLGDLNAALARVEELIDASGNR